MTAIIVYGPVVYSGIRRTRRDIQIAPGTWKRVAADATGHTVHENPTKRRRKSYEYIYGIIDI